jgi:PAT family beta-lactamase induction signal transducer AmpG
VSSGSGGSRWWQAVGVYASPRIAALGLLGFSAGLPFVLVYSTLSVWLREADVDLATIGFFSWLTLVYSVKVLWSPVVDSVRLPWLGDLLGRRRSWLLLAQMVVIAGLLGVAGIDPAASLVPVAAFGLMVALGSATQDIVVDAYRIEVADTDEQAALSAVYIFGYRLAMLVAGAGALYIAEFISWPAAYMSMAACMVLGVLTTLLVSEPRVADRVVHSDQARGRQRLVMWLRRAVIAPFIEFFNRNGSALALLVLALIMVYRLSDMTMGVMANPFYLDTGFSKAEIASVVKVFGFGMTMLGAFVGGVLVLRFGQRLMLLVAAGCVVLTNLAFAGLSLSGEPSLTALAFVVSADNFSGGLANVTFIAFLSGLTHRTYTATQYALFSSLMTSIGGVVGGFSGLIVDGFGYTTFFVYAALLGLPAIGLVLILGRRTFDLMAGDPVPRDGRGAHGHP